jgi:N4-gp56 family major capsid protein
MSLTVSGDYYGAGSGTDAYAGKFIPEIWSGKLQVKFYQSTVLSEITNNDWEGEIKDQGDKVEIRTVPTITISNYSKGQTLSSQVPTTDLVELLIDKGKYFQTVVDDVDDVQSDLKLMDIFTNDASQQMKIAIDTDVLSALVGASVSANEGATAGAISGDLNLGVSTGQSKAAVEVTSTNVIDKVITMGQVLDEQNAPEDGRWLIIPAWLAAKIKTSDLKDASITGDSMTPLRNGRLGMIDRFTLYVSNLLPSQTGITGEGQDSSVKAFSCFAGTRDAITFASQITRMETLRSQTTFGNLVRGLNVYGYKVIKPEALVEGFFYKG